MPDHAFLGLRKLSEGLASDLRLVAAVKWYESGTVGQREAAEITGLSRKPLSMVLKRRRSGITSVNPNGL